MPIGAYWTFRRMWDSLSDKPSCSKKESPVELANNLSEKILNVCKSYVYDRTNGEGYVDISPSLKSERKIFECYKNRESQWAFACLTMQGERILGFMDEDFEKYVKENLK